jgi:hypothetical protein
MRNLNVKTCTALYFVYGKFTVRAAVLAQTFPGDKHPDQNKNTGFTSHAG